MTALRVADTDWNLKGGSITRGCTYTGLLEDASTHALQIDISSKRSLTTGLPIPVFNLKLSPNPFLGLTNSSLVGQIAVRDSSYDAPTVPVVISHADEREMTMSTMSAQHAELVVHLLSLGESLQFTVFRGSEALIELPITNNAKVVNLFRQVLT